MADKLFDPEDPMHFMGVGMACDPKEFDEMVEAVIEEFLLMGWTDRMVLQMFHTPFYQLPYSVLQQKGEAYVLEAMARVRKAWTPAV